MKILLLGKDGQVGWELQRSLIPLGELHAYGREDCDLADTEKLRKLIRELTPDIIVNAAAYTAVDKAEGDSSTAERINVAVPALLAEEAKTLNAWLVHYSTDYVFDGKKSGDYNESDATMPLSVYGRTKLAGEKAITESGCQHLIFRTSWVFAARGANFIKTILRLARERSSLNAVGDQHGAPTSAELIADVTALCLQHCLASCGGGRQPENDTSFSGIYHLTASGSTTWHGYAQYAIGYAIEQGLELACRPDNVLSIPATEYPAPAKRPANSRLDTSKLRTTFGLTMPAWDYHVRRTLDEVLATDLLKGTA